MTSALTIASQRYEQLLNKFAEVYTRGELNNLKRYYEVGGLFNEFCSGLTAKRYGTKTIEALAEDLAARGALSEVKDSRRFLYWAKALRDHYPEFAALEELASKGFSLTHAKLLFSLEPKALEKIEKKMADEDGNVLSTRELDQLIQDTLRKSGSAAALEAAAEARKEREEGEKPPGVPSAGSDIEEIAGTPYSEDEKAEKGGKEDKKPAPSDKKVVKGEIDPPNPLKTMNATEKLVTKLVAEIPDAFIVIRAIQKRGFDSDKAHKNFKDTVANLRSGIQAAIEPLSELLKLIQEYESGEE